MSFSDSRGVQLDPGELTGSIVVRFGDATTSTTATAVGARLGLAAEQVADTMRELIGCGFLVELEDGTYAADLDTTEVCP